MDFSGTSVRSEVTPRSFDLLSDDVLCSYDEFTSQLDPTINDKRPDPTAKDLDDSGLRSPSANLYGQTEFPNEDVLSAVEKCMEKYADNLMMHFEGIGGRLTQLESYCHKLEQSIGDFRTDMIHDQGEGDLKLKSLEKHVHEVHRSVKIIRDKQEFSETPKELAKLLLSPGESTNSIQPQKNSEGLNAASSENKPYNTRGDVPNQHLTLPLPHQISSSFPPSLATSAPDKIYHPYKDSLVQQPAPILCVLPQDHYFLNQANTYSYNHHQPHPQDQQSQNLQPELHYVQQMPQMCDLFVQDESKQHPSGLRTLPTYASYAFIQDAVKCPESYQDNSYLPTLYSIPHNTQKQTLPQAIHGSFAPTILMNGGYAGTGMAGDPVYFISGGGASHSPNGKVIARGPSDHPLEDMIEKAVGMGYPRDQVLSAVRRIAESGQPLDLNLFLGRLKTLAGGGLHPV